MPRLAANLSMMFNEVPFLDRFAAARKAGFDGVEFLFPYEHPAAELRKRLDGEGLTQALFNMPPGDWAKGERGLASLPGRQARVPRRREAGARLCRGAGLQAGALHGGDRAGGRIAGDGRRACMPRTWPGRRSRQRRPGVKLVIEPINHRDMPGYFLNTEAQGAAVVEAIGRDRLGLQFDVYHCQTTEGDITKRMEQFMPVIAHMQIADVPARNEPGTGRDRLEVRVPADG